MWPCSSESIMLQRHHASHLPPSIINNNNINLGDLPNNAPVNMNAAGGGLFNRGHHPHGGLLDDPIFGGLSATNFMNAAPSQRPMHNMFAGNHPNISNNGYNTSGLGDAPSLYNSNMAPNKSAFHHHQLQHQQWNNHPPTNMRPNPSAHQNFGAPHNSGSAGLKNSLFQPFGSDQHQPGMAQKSQQQQQQQQQYGLLGLQNFNPSAGGIHGDAFHSSPNQAGPYSNNASNATNNNMGQQLNAIGGAGHMSLNESMAKAGLNKITGHQNVPNHHFNAAQKINELRNLMENVNSGGSGVGGNSAHRNGSNMYEQPNNVWALRDQQHHQQQQQQLYNSASSKGSGGGGILNIAPSNQQYSLENINGSGNHTSRTGLISHVIRGAGGGGGSGLLDNGGDNMSYPPNNNNNQSSRDSYGLECPDSTRAGRDAGDDNHFTFPPSLTNNINYSNNAHNNLIPNKVVGGSALASNNTNAARNNRFSSYRGAASNSSTFNAYHEGINDLVDEAERSSSISGRSGASTAGTGGSNFFGGNGPGGSGAASFHNQQQQQYGNNASYHQNKGSDGSTSAGTWQNKYGNQNDQLFSLSASTDPSSASKDVNGTSLWATAISSSTNVQNPVDLGSEMGQGLLGSVSGLSGFGGSALENSHGGSESKGKDNNQQPPKDSLLYDEEFIKRVVNTPTGWGKVPIKQDAAWEHHSESPEPDACTIGTQIWKSTDAPNMGGGGGGGGGPQSLLSGQHSYGMWKGDNEINQWHAETSALNINNSASSGSSSMHKDKDHTYQGDNNNNGDTWSNHAAINPPTQPWNQFSDGAKSHNMPDLSNGQSVSMNQKLIQRNSQSSADHPSHPFLMAGNGNNNPSLQPMNNGPNQGFGMSKPLNSTGNGDGLACGTTSFFGGEWPLTPQTSSDGSSLNEPHKLNGIDRSSLALTANQQQQQQQQQFSSNIIRSGLGADDWQQSRHGQHSALIDAAFKAVGSMIGSVGDSSSKTNNHAHGDEDYFGASAGGLARNPANYKNGPYMQSSSALPLLPPNAVNQQQNASQFHGLPSNNGGSCSSGSRKFMNATATSATSSKIEDDDDEEDGGGIGVWKSVEAAKQESSMYWNSNMVNNMEPGESLSVLGPANPPAPRQNHQQQQATPPSGGNNGNNSHNPSFHHLQQATPCGNTGGWGEYDTEMIAPDHHTMLTTNEPSHGQSTGGNFDDGTSIWAQNTNVQIPNQPSIMITHKSDKPSFSSMTWSQDNKDPTTQSHINAWLNNKEFKESDFNKNLWSNDDNGNNNNFDAIQRNNNLSNAMNASNNQNKNGAMNSNWPPNNNNNSMKSSDLRMLGLIKEDIESLLTKNQTYQMDNLGNNNNNNNINTSSSEMLNGGYGGGGHLPSQKEGANKGVAGQLKPFYDNSSGPLDLLKTDAHVLQMMGKGNMANSQLNSRNFQQQELSPDTSSMMVSRGQILSSLNIPSINGNNPQNAMNSKMIQLQKNVSPAQILSNPNHQTNNNATNFTSGGSNGGGNNMPGGPPAHHNTSLINQQLDQLNMAISSGLINPHILNLKLSPQILVMLQQLLSYHKILQTMQVQQQTLMNKKGLNMQLQRQQLEHLQSKIDQVRHQIVQLQNNIAVATQSNVPETSAASPSSNGNNNEQDGHDAPSQAAHTTDTQSNIYGGGDSLSNDPISPTYQKSRLQQWKLPSPEKGEGDSTCNQASSALVASTTSNAPAPINDAKAAAPGGMQINASSSKASVSSETSSKSELNIAEFEPGKPWSGFKNVENDPYMTPGSLAARNQMTLNSLKDSEVFNSLDSTSTTTMCLAEDGGSSSQINPSSLYASALHSASSDNDIKEGDYWPTNNAPNNGNEANFSAAASFNVQSNQGSGGNNVYHPQTASAYYRPSASSANNNNVIGALGNNNFNNNGKVFPPQLNNPGGSFGSLTPAPAPLSSSMGKNKTGSLSSSTSSTNSSASSFPNNKFGLAAAGPGGQQYAWKGHPSEHSAFNSVYGANKADKATWLVLKNLTSQVDGSTLKTLCQQHGPVQHFYLNRSTGSALALYGTREEAGRAERSLHSVVLWNAPLQAETAPYDAYPLPPPPITPQPLLMAHQHPNSNAGSSNVASPNQRYQ